MTVGRCEWVGLPELGLACLEARMGWGRQSWLWVGRISGPTGDGWVRFRVHPFPNDPGSFVEAEAPVESSRQGPVTISTWFVLGNVAWSSSLELRPLPTDGRRRDVLTLGLGNSPRPFTIDHSFRHGLEMPRVVGLGELDAWSGSGEFHALEPGSSAAPSDFQDPEPARRSPGSGEDL